MRIKKLLAACMAATMVLGGFGGEVNTLKTVEAATFTDLCQDEIVAEMGAGWNLGNQLEASIGGVPYETAWGNPQITENLIETVKDAGFSTIRIPVSYLSKIGSAPNYTIDSSWLNRVQEVVDMCIENDLYVIINMHGDGYHSVDGGWLFCDGADQTTIRAKYEAGWEQIATKFKEYDEHLIFESMNEEFDGTYGTPNRTYYSNINELNQIFVDTVRQTGGNNDRRWLLVPGWNTNIEYTAGDYGFEVPSDTYRSKSISSDEKRIMISVHYYDPWAFCGEENAATTQWGDSATDGSKVASYGDETFLKTQLQNMYTKFSGQGYPVVIGEYGAIDKSSYDSNNLKCRVEFAEKVCTYAKEYGCVPVWWDNGYNGVHGFGLFDRNSCTVTQQSIIDGIMKVYSDSEVSPSETAKPDDSTDSGSSDSTDGSGETVIFSNGSSNESYATADASWLLNASDDAVITIKYTCTDASHAYWGILGWGASVDGNWKNGISYSASVNAADTVTVTCTAKELKNSLSISDNSTVEYLALSAYNNGKILNLSIADSCDENEDGSSGSTNPDDSTTQEPTSPDDSSTQEPTNPEDSSSSDSSAETVIFSEGAANESYETTDGSWILNASDDAVITVKYTCTDASHAYWGILSWGASVDGGWKSGISYNASDNATEIVTVTYSASEFKKSLGISNNSTISYLALSAYNSGKIVSITITD